MKSLISLTVLFTLLIITPQQALAVDPGCKPLYNGGVTSQQVCDGKISTPEGTQPAAKATPTPIKSGPTPTPIKLKSGTTGPTTKGGLTVLSPAPAQNTPSTGPEALGVIALIPFGAFGYYLRKKI